MQVTSLLKILKELKKLVHPVRFELTTTGLKGRCSTVELRMHYLKNKRNSISRPAALSTPTLWTRFSGSQAQREKFFEILIFFDIINRCPKKKKKLNN